MTTRDLDEELRAVVRRILRRLDQDGRIECHGHIRPRTECASCRDIVEAARLVGIDVGVAGIFSYPE